MNENNSQVVNKIKKGDLSLIIKLLLGIVIGSILGLLATDAMMNVIVSLRHICGQIIFFLVPLVIVSFIAPAIINLGRKASKILFVAIALAYFSSLGAALFSTLSGYIVIPWLSIASQADKLRSLPEMVFRLDIPPLMSVMSALTFALLAGVAIAWTKSQTLEKIFLEMEKIMTWLIANVLIPILPWFVGMSFMTLAYEGSLTIHLPIFIGMVIIVLIGHFIWLTILYSIGGLVAKRKPAEVYKHYTLAYLTAVGTMSSAATLPVSLECIKKSSAISNTIAEFMIPLGATVHLCGSVLTETFFCMTISLMLYGSLPPVGIMIIFSILLAIFAVGAPGVPGGTVVASLGIVTAILGFDQNGVALLIAIFALQDSFGTACNVTGDGALALILEGIFNRNGELEQNKTLLADVEQ